MPFGTDGQTIGPSAETLAENKRQDNLAKERQELQRRMVESDRIEAQEAAEVAQAAIVTEELRVDALANWKAHGGLEREFKEVWPQIRLQLLQQKLLTAQAEERADFERRLAAVRM